MVLAAGEGRRLRPLTADVPKPLLPVGDEPLLKRTLCWLARLSFDQAIINVHHLGDRIVSAMTDAVPPGLRVHWSREQVLLGTGGGIHHALPLWSEDAAWIWNADVVADIDLRGVEARRPRAADALMIVRRGHQSDAGGGVYLGEAAGGFHRVVGIREHGDTRGEPYLFTGVHWLRRDRAGELREPGDVVADGYARWIAAGRVYAAVHHGYWNEIGTPDRYAAVQADFAAGRLPWLDGLRHHDTHHARPTNRR
jgi:NDP-sugar pyrophosphorylase family protein